MSGVRDPAFWKRFSVAVHEMDDVEARPEMKRGDSWLAKERRKSRRHTCMCYTFWILFPGLIAGVVIAIIVLIKTGVFKNIHI